MVPRLSESFRDWANSDSPNNWEKHHRKHVDTRPNTAATFGVRITANVFTTVIRFFGYWTDCKQFLFSSKIFGEEGKTSKIRA